MTENHVILISHNFIFSLSLSLSLQVALRIILFIPELTCYLLASAWLCGQCYKFDSFKNKPIFSQTQPYLWVFTVTFFPFPCPINHQGLAVFLEWYSEWSPDQQSSWDLIRNANSWPLQTYLNQKHWNWGLAICVLKSLQVVLLHAQAWPSLP